MKKIIKSGLIFINLTFLVLLFLGAIVDTNYRLIAVGFILTLIYGFFLQRKTDLSHDELYGTSAFLAILTVGIIWIFMRIIS